jgi:hypothetical protein
MNHRIDTHRDKKFDWSTHHIGKFLGLGNIGTIFVSVERLERLELLKLLEPITNYLPLCVIQFTDADPV